MGLSRFSLAVIMMINVMVLLEGWWTCYGCLEEERSALLQIKSTFNYPNGTTQPSWGKVADCCDWEGVSCNFTTGRVVSLRLYGTRDSGLGDLYLNASLFLPFQELEQLYLSENHIVGCVENEGFERLSGLDSLVFLDLGDNKLDNSILSSLGALSSLETLWLYGNQLEGAISLDALASLKNLEVLDLTFCTLDNSFLQTVGNITTLKSLFLESCGINGSIPTTQGLCQLKHLQNLIIRENDLHGALPWCLANLTSLQQLDLSSNHFIGDISLSPLASLTSIQVLQLSDNHFQIPFSLSPFFNLSKLISLHSYNNEIYAELEEHNLAPKFQLQFFYLYGQGQEATFPKFLFHQHKLLEIAISNMKIRGRFPNWLLENNTNLVVLYLVNNSLSGPFQLPVHPHLELDKLLISNNHFNSHIPTEIGSYLPRLTFLSMSGNHFSGPIPSSFDLMRDLQVLDLSNNNISETLPSFSSNVLHVYLSKNMLQGLSERAFQNSSELITLDLSHNRLTGSVPKWIGELSQLRFLLLGHNNIDGRIPIQLCKLDILSFIDLSHNYFFGHILPCLRVRERMGSTEQERHYKYSLPQEPVQITTKSMSYFFSPSVLYYMTGMDLSSNNLTGEIPQEIGNLNSIHLLNLSNNRLTGSIPQIFSNLSQVESLDLSYNNLNGKIPPQLIALHALAVFSVAHNNLSGRTPEMVAQFSTFNKSSYEDNPFLCGPPLLKNCTNEEAPSSPPRTSIGDKEESGFIDSSVFYVSFVVTYIMVLLGIAAVLYINPNWRGVWFHFIEEIINNCYYFLVDNLPVPLRFRFWKPFA